VQGKERPPILTVAEYRRRYGIGEDEAAVAAGETAGATGKGCLGPLLDERNIILDLAARDRDGAIRELVDLAIRGSHTSNPEEPAEAIIRRENRVSTNVGHGVALPHVITDAVDEIVVALGRSAAGIDFPSALVRRRVNIVVLILAPNSRRASYLNTLSCLAGLFRHRKLVQDLINTNDRAEAISLLRKYESLISLQKQLHPRRWG
jgi:mannitol/fructose-specific phosphotransferase system IIA component (Ntr-type)